MVGFERRLWISEWNSGNVSVYDPASKTWKQWKLPGQEPHTYAVWVDPDDEVWLSEWTAYAVVCFDPVTETFDSFPSDRQDANVRQMLGRKGEVWIGTHPRDYVSGEGEVTRTSCGRLLRAGSSTVRP